MSSWRFQIGQGRDGDHRWSLVNPAATAVYQSPKGYATAAAAVRAARRTREQIGAAPISKSE